MSNTITAAASGNGVSGLGYQTHIIYATNSARWWAFWLSSATVIASAYSSDGATWTAGATKTLSNSVSVNSNTTADGRGFSLAYKNISSTDVVHFSLGEEAASGNSSVGHYHLRATISGTTVTYGSDALVGITFTDGAASYGPEGGTTTIDANNKVIDGADWYAVGSWFEDVTAGTFPNADTGSAWTMGTATQGQIFSAAARAAGTWVGALGSGSNVVLVGANGSSDAKWTNLSYAVWNGTSWGTTGSVLAASLGTAADLNDYGCVVLDATHLMVVWRNGSTNLQYRIGTISGSSISWTTAAALPTSGLTQPASATGGIALVSDGAHNVWCAVIDSGTGTNVKYCAFNTTGAWSAGSWGTWTTLEAASATRVNIGISPQNDGSGSANYVVYWAEGAAIKCDLLATSSGSLSWVAADSQTNSDGVSAVAVWSPTADAQPQVDAWGAVNYAVAWGDTQAASDAWVVPNYVYTPPTDAQTNSDAWSTIEQWTPLGDGQTNLDAQTLTLGWTPGDSQIASDAATWAIAWTPPGDSQTQFDGWSTTATWTPAADSQQHADALSSTAVWTPADAQTTLDAASWVIAWAPVADSQSTLDAWTATLVGGLVWNAVDQQANTDAANWGAVWTQADQQTQGDSQACTLGWAPNADSQGNADAWTATLEGTLVWNVIDSQTSADGWVVTAGWAPLADAQTPQDAQDATAAWTPLGDSQTALDALLATLGWGPLIPDSQQHQDGQSGAFSWGTLADAQTAADGAGFVMRWVVSPADAQTNLDTGVLTPISGLTPQTIQVTWASADGTATWVSADGAVTLVGPDGTVTFRMLT